MISNRIKKVMGDVFGMDPARIGDETSPDDIGQWDSLRHMMLVAALEEEFDIRLPDESIPELLNFRQIESHLRALLPSGE